MRGRIRLIDLALIICLASTFHLPAAETASQAAKETAGASQPTADDTSDLAKQSQNPVADLISLPLQNNFNFDTGPGDDMQYQLLVQPVLPVRLSEKWNMINRAIVPVIYQPRLSLDSGSRTGLGDVQYQPFISPAKPGKLIWGVGPVFTFPTATDDILGAEKWSAGPNVVALTIQGPWVVGAIANNQWSFAGDSDRNHVNSLFLQYFINYNIPKSKGWYLSSSPSITANWKADSDQRWTVPVGGGIGKVFKIGKQPLNAKLQAFGYPEKPDHGPEWSLQFQLTFLFPK